MLSLVITLKGVKGVGAPEHFLQENTFFRKKVTNSRLLKSVSVRYVVKLSWFLVRRHFVT